SLAALATVLHFLTLGSKEYILLPRPYLLITSTPGPSILSNILDPITSSISISKFILEEYKRLPYYIILSCNYQGMFSLLGGSFFNLTIEYNIVSS
ncbi:hypothetical protein CC78DRAFT_474700, partial [Lojkania enalia]